MFVIYHKDTTRYARKPNGYEAKYTTMRAAKAARTRNGWDESVWHIAEAGYFQDHIEKMVTVTNLMTGSPVQQRANTPRSCDVSSELYWCM